LRAAPDERLLEKWSSEPLRSVEDSRLVGEIECDAALLGLVRAGGSRLEHDRVAELTCRLDGLSRRGRHALGHQRNAVGLEQATRLLGVEPAAAGRDRLPYNGSALFVIALELGHRACRLPEPLAALGRSPERARRRLGIRKGG